ncbi:MAG: division/cell wall cluster transcriptional repressor MraZ [Treponema sp.]|nr:division/cell wall cluster transcriptional repressor MraZ [Treponema sp.]
MLSGEFSVTLDDTGRISLPRRLRDILGTDKIVLTKGADSCLWLYTAENWRVQEEDIVSKTDQFSSRGRLMRQHFIGPKQDLDIDRQGRILIPPTLRDHAGLSKDCIVLGQFDYIEIWAEDRYKAYLDASADDFRAGMEDMSALRMKERNSGNYGSGSRSGAAGGDNTVSGAKGQA